MLDKPLSLWWGLAFLFCAMLWSTFRLPASGVRESKSSSLTLAVAIEHAFVHHQVPDIADEHEAAAGQRVRAAAGRRVGAVGGEPARLLGHGQGATDRPASLSRRISSPNGKPHLMPASRAFVDANSCVACFGKPLNPCNLHHFATPTIGQFGTAGHQQSLERGHEPPSFV
jgi:hypothetical protein